MAETIETLVTEFRADIKRYEAQLRRQVRETQKAANRSERTWKKANASIARGFNKTGMTARAAMVGIGVAAVASTKTIADFGQAMANVAAVTEASETQLAKMRAQARELGATTRFSATEAAEGMLFLARAGFEVDQIMGGIEPTLRLAQAGAIGLGDAADISSNILQAFQLDVSELTRVVDVMAKTTNSSNTDIRQLGDAMKLVAPISRVLGVDIEETSAFIGALSDAGMQATLAGTGLRRVMSELQAPTTATKKILKEYGIDAEDVKVSTVGLSGALQVLADKNFDATRAMEVFGQRGGPAFANAFAAFTDGKIEDLIDQLENAAGTATKMGAIMDNTLGGAMKRALSRLQELIITLGDLGAEQALIDFFEGLANAFENLATWAEKAARAYHMFVTDNKDLTAATYDLRDAVDAYDQAIKDANGKTGYALELANKLKNERREQAIETLKAAQAERTLAIEAEKAEVRRLRGKLSGNQRGGTQLRNRQLEAIRAASDAVQELERQMRETEDMIIRMEQGIYELGVPASEAPLVDPDDVLDPAATRDNLEETKKDVFGFLDELEKNMADAKKAIANEHDLIEDLKDSRDELYNRTASIMDREFARRERQIEDEIRNEQRKNEALALLAEERVAAEAALRDEVLGQGQHSTDEVERIRALEEVKLETLQDAYDKQLISLQEFEDRKQQIVEQSEEAIAKARAISVVAQTDAYASLFGNMAGLAKEFAGEQSGIFKALFAAEKAFAIASSIISIQTGIAKAMSLPFPANLGAAATVAAQGASIIANLRAVSGNGFKDGVVGLGGPGGPRSDSIPAMLSRGESVVTAAATGKNAALLAAMNAGADVQGNLAKMSAGPGRSISSTVVVHGNVDQDIWPKVQAAMQEQTQVIMRAVPGVARATALSDKKRRLY
jgi:TP901 family phage tail tape measure protein